MKKKIALTVLAIFLIFCGIFVWYYMSTMSALECIEYCQENSKRDAMEFQPFADDRYKNRYTYWIASDGDSSKSQEIFVFRLKRFLGLDISRYQYVASSVESDVEKSDIPIGSMQFFTRKDDGEKEAGATLLLYGSAAESDIFYCEYTLTTNDFSEIHKEKVLLGDKGWLVKITDIGNIEKNIKKEVTNIKFYDIDNNLIYEY